MYNLYNTNTQEKKMLQLKNITKDYVTASETVQALKGVSLSFRQKEFVSILGPSGCGKTTMLNIIGGLDHYTSGDLIIAGRSTKSYKDRDWDVYRNHRIGFIFQSYNLIPHQTVLGNVELSLTIAGLSKEERTRKAKLALDKVGLSDKYYKRPNQLSGGQCQRVAIARALVNDPEILLADEPTGALDTVTSKQIMDLIKEISGERLVIMVTHNPEIAEEYSTRIIRLLDGQVLEDTNPFSPMEEEAECVRIAEEIKAKEEEIAAAEAAANAKKQKKQKKEKAKMSFFTAFMLSLKNLFTKKGRTTLTAFAGSIGIIGIALILAVSQGMTAYIDHVQETTLSSYPLTLESTTIDASALIESILGGGEDTPNDGDAVYKDPLIAELVDALSKVETSENDLTAFKKFLDGEMAKADSELKNAIMGIRYSYNINLPIYTKNQDGKIIKSDTAQIMTEMLADYMMGIASKNNNSNQNNNSSENTQGGFGSGSSMMGSMMGVKMWEELLPGNVDENGNRAYVNDILYEQYELVNGSWPSAKNEIILVLNENNELDDLTLYALGLLSEADIDAIIDAAVNKTPLPEGSKNRWTYDEIRALTFRTIFPYKFYQQKNDGTYFDASKNATLLEMLYNGDSTELKVSGIIRPKKDAETTMLTGSIAYTYALTEQIIEEAVTSPVVMAQMQNPNYDILTGLPFNSTSGKLSAAEKKVEFNEYIASLSDAEKIAVYVEIQCLKAEAENLEATMEMMLANMPDDPAVLVESIIAGLGDTDVDTDTLREYFSDMTAEELKNLLKPEIQKQASRMIRSGVEAQMSMLDDQTKLMALTAELSTATDESFALYYDKITKFSPDTYDEVLEKIGKLDLESPSAIHLFATSFENKDVIVEQISSYNSSVSDDKKIAYTDFFGIMMSSITTIINAISYVLIAFVAISLVVSSIMIGVITLISVQERTKEIGVLRAIGASKRDVSSMFNAETIIIGLAAGLLGILVTYLLCIPINIILYSLTGLANLKAVLSPIAALILVLISVALTLISGLIPARSAAKKDPVIALRTE